MSPVSFLLLKNIYIYFWLRWVFARLCMGFSCGAQGLLSGAVRGLLFAVASFVAEQALGTWLW